MDRYKKSIEDKFGRKRFLKSKVIPHYPQSVEREYLRLADSYMALLNGTLSAHLHKIRGILNKYGGDSFKADAADDEQPPIVRSPVETGALNNSIDEIFSEISADFQTRRELFGLAAKLERISKVNRKLTIAEWKRVVKQTLGINIMEDYYNGAKFQRIIDKWIEENVGLIKKVPQDTLDKMREAIKDSFLSGSSLKNLTNEVLKLNPSDFGFKSEMSYEAYQKSISEYQKAKRHAQFIARDQTAKLNAQLTQAHHADAGVTEYIWSTSGDRRVRESHAVLNNKRFSYNNPPVVNEKTGERKNPGEDYRCRCVALPVFDIDTVVLPWERAEKERGQK
jgi:SPP1 gp7 family putative phage head morphogenesis protein